MRLPDYLQIEPVGQCNLRCQMCAIQFRQDGPPYGPPAFMRFETFASLMDEFEGLSRLHLQGLGEPMMHPQFFEMVRMATSRGIETSTNSNLTLLNDARAEECVTSGLERLHVSIDGGEAETYERIRARAHFDRVMANVERFVDARRRAGSETPRLHIVVVAMRQNLHELPEIVRMARGWGAEEVFVQHLCHDFAESSLPAQYRPMREFVEEQTLLAEEPAVVRAAFDRARAVAAGAGVRLRLPHPERREYGAGVGGRERCDWPWTSGYVSYDGHVMPCCMISTPDRMNFGRVDERGFAELWSSERYEAFRRQLDAGPPPEICSTCSVYNGTF